MSQDTLPVYTAYVFDGVFEGIIIQVAAENEAAARVAVLDEVCQVVGTRMRSCRVIGPENVDRSRYEIVRLLESDNLRALRPAVISSHSCADWVSRDEMAGKYGE